METLELTQRPGGTFYPWQQPGGGSPSSYQAAEREGSSTILAVDQSLEVDFSAIKWSACGVDIDRLSRPFQEYMTKLILHGSKHGTIPDPVRNTWNGFDEKDYERVTTWDALSRNGKKFALSEEKDSDYDLDRTVDPIRSYIIPKSTWRPKTESTGVEGRVEVCTKRRMPTSVSSDDDEPLSQRKKCKTDSEDATGMSTKVNVTNMANDAVVEDIIVVKCRARDETPTHPLQNRSSKKARSCKSSLLTTSVGDDLVDRDVGRFEHELQPDPTAVCTTAFMQPTAPPHSQLRGSEIPLSASLHPRSLTDRTIEHRMSASRSDGQMGRRMTPASLPPPTRLSPFLIMEIRQTLLERAKQSRGKTVQLLKEGDEHEEQAKRMLEANYRDEFGKYMLDMADASRQRSIEHVQDAQAFAEMAKKLGDHLSSESIFPKFEGRRHHRYIDVNLTFPTCLIPATIKKDFAL